MKKNKLQVGIMLALAGAVFSQVSVDAAFDENLSNYTLESYTVKADQIKDQFGNTITEQSYYRTGGDVKVITREEIERRHYTDLTEAIKRIPGVTFQNPGYRGGEYGYQFYNNGVSINGDTRVVVLVDGRRVDNAASERISSRSNKGSKSTGVNLDQITHIDNVDKIEVIKGPGASVYGSDAMGGVINVITRKGGATNEGVIDLSTGSWSKHNMNVTYSGSTQEEHPLRYFATLTRTMSQDTKYKDAFTGENATLGGSKWREEGGTIRLDKELNDKQNIKLSYNYKRGKDGYPIATPNRLYWNQEDWNRIIFNAAVGQLDENNKLIPKTLSGDAKNPGYHNLYALDGQGYNSFSRFTNKDVELNWTFDKDGDLESFVRVYNQDHKYENRDVYFWRKKGVKTKDAQAQYQAAFPNGASKEELKQWIADNLAPFPGNKEALEKWVEATGGKATDPKSWEEEKNKGIQVQYAKSFGKHDVIASVTYDKARKYSKYINPNDEVESSRLQRTSLYGYVQDKIHVNDNFDVTPALRFVSYSDYKEVDGGTVQNKGGKAKAVTPALNLEYRFKDKSAAYFGWTKVERPLRSGDYLSTNGIYNTKLENEVGNVWTAGYRKTFNGKTTVGVNYDHTNMSNAIATFPIYDETSSTFKSTAVNAKERKDSFNITVDHQVNDNLSVGVAYSHMKDKWGVKSGYVVDPSWGYNDSDDINLGINNLRPKNHYTLNVNYQKGKLSTGLLANWYTGASKRAFTSKRFLVLDWNLNYDASKDFSAYVVVNNLTNKAYETSYNAWNGVGSSAMPGRSIMVGTRYKF